MKTKNILFIICVVFQSFNSIAQVALEAKFNGTDTYETTYPGVLPIYQHGMIVTFRGDNNNTGITKLDLGIGGKEIRKKGGTADLEKQDILTNQFVTVVFDALDCKCFQMLSTASTLGAGATLPAGAAGQTLYHDGTTWQASDFLYNDGTIVKVGNGTAPSAPNTYTLQVLGTVGSNGINETSDKRYKTDIKTLDSSLVKITQLRGVNYNWKTKEYADKNFSEKHQIGVIAQEIEKIFPELVDTDKTGFKSVQYSKLVAVLIEAIKEQQKIISTQNEDISNLKTSVAKISTIESQLKLLTELVEMQSKQIQLVESTNKK